MGGIIGRGLAMNEAEKCPICEEEGIWSEIIDYEIGGAVKKFIGGDGKEHIHSREEVEYVYQCSRGHHFRKRGKLKCSTCGWEAS